MLLVNNEQGGSADASMAIHHPSPERIWIGQAVTRPFDTDSVMDQIGTVFSCTEAVMGAVPEHHCRDL
jgi:hypothetical protein